MTEVAQSLRQVRERLRAACSKAGRATDAVRLVAVSKKQPVEAIRAAFAEGQRDFGENYVQELAAKAAALSDLPGLCWHFIGHLQRNKAAQAVTLASLVQAVDSERLAIELGRRAEAQGRRLPVLVEVNVGGETQKSGVAPTDLPALLAVIEAQTALALRGLMTVPPHTEDPAGARPFFDQLVALRNENGGPDRLPELSMGMTHDLEQAIFAGATMVRVGTAIFGARG